MATPVPFAQRFDMALRAMEYNRGRPSTIARNQFAWYSELVGVYTREDPVLAGLLTTKYDLGRRIAASRKEGVARPELQARLKAIKAEIAKLEGGGPSE